MSPTAGRRRASRLLLLVLLLLAVVWVLRLRGHRPAPPPAVGLGLPPDWGETCRWVVVHGDDSVVVVREGAELRIRQPLLDRADPGRLAEIDRQARELQPARVLPDTALGTFGLERPRARLVLTDGDGRTWGIALGDSSPVGEEVYARALRENAPVVLIDRFVGRTYLAPSLESLRDRTPASLRPGAVDSVVVWTGGGRGFAARRVSGDRWISRQPLGFRVDPLSVAGVVEFLRSPVITGFSDVGGTLFQWGLAPPRAVWILFQGARAETVRVGNPTPEVASVHILPGGGRGPALVGSDHFRTLVDGWPAVADRRLLSLAPESLETVEFVGQPRGGSYRKDGAKWRREPGGREAAHPRLLESDLRNLTVLRWRNFPEPPVTPTTRGRLTLALRTAQRAETLMLAAPGDTIGWVRSSRQPRWGEISAQVWRTWQYRLDHP
jgi:hypothetical protein